MAKAGSGASPASHNLTFNNLGILEKYLLDSFHLWNAGLSLDRYQKLNAIAIKHPYAKKNYSFVALNNPNYSASLKLYKFNLIHSNKTYNVLGLGAIYTAKKMRNQGLAQNLISRIIDLAKKNKLDAIVLFSDIDADFYEKFGFKIISSKDKIINLAKIKNNFDKINLSNLALKAKDAKILAKIYSKNCASVAFRRCHHNFAFKIFKCNFLIKHSYKYPPIYRIIDKSYNSYLIFEISGRKLRILEISSNYSSNIRHRLMSLISQFKINKISCYSNTFNKLAKILPKPAISSIKTQNRKWGIFMILFLNEKLNVSAEKGFNFIQEFDYF